jgi:hypothetical protein
METAKRELIQSPFHESLNVQEKCKQQDKTGARGMIEYRCSFLQNVALVRADNCFTLSPWLAIWLVLQDQLLMVWRNQYCRENNLFSK